MKKHYYLVSALVVYQKDKLERTKPLNVLMPVNNNLFGRTELAIAQRQVHIRFIKEYDPEGKAEVLDIYNQSISYLGEMTEAEFHGEFDYPGKPKPEATQPATGDVQVQAETPATEQDNASPEPSTEVNEKRLTNGQQDQY